MSQQGQSTQGDAGTGLSGPSSAPAATTNQTTPRFPKLSAANKVSPRQYRVGQMGTSSQVTAQNQLGRAQVRQQATANNLAAQANGHAAQANSLAAQANNDATNRHQEQMTLEQQKLTAAQTAEQNTQARHDENLNYTKARDAAADQAKAAADLDAQKEKKKADRWTKANFAAFSVPGLASATAIVASNYDINNRPKATAPATTSGATTGATTTASLQPRHTANMPEIPPNPYMQNMQPSGTGTTTPANPSTSYQLSPEEVAALGQPKQGTTLTTSVSRPPQATQTGTRTSQA